MIYHVSHRTEITYAAPVSLARFNLRLHPAAWPGQTISEHRLIIDPVPWARREEDGPFVVNTSRITLRDPIEALTITSRFMAEVTTPVLDLAATASPDLVSLREAALARQDLGPLSPASYLFASPIAQPSAEIAQWAGQWLTDATPVLAAGAALMGAIHDQFRYEEGATEADTAPIEAFHARHGVCQDFAHVMIVAARAYGLPAAYVSGYLRTLPPPGKKRLVGADATHAWVNLWCGEALGWIGFDPTNNVIVASDHIFTAMGRDYADVAPLDGVFHGGGGRQRMKVAVDVEPFPEGDVSCEVAPAAA
jgi:transglutaminase-like putative cysteine protease